MIGYRRNDSEARVLFANRRAAGKRLIEPLSGYRGRNALVLGIPRGGVPVADEIAQGLAAELDIVVARKVGAPNQPELAIGAVTANGGRFFNEELIQELDISDTYLERAVAREVTEARRREASFRTGRPLSLIKNRVVILVDDGLATGATMRAAVRSIRTHYPAKLVVAVPVGSEQAVEGLSEEVDEVVCLYRPDPFYAVGPYYADFAPVADAEVQEILREGWARRTDTAGLADNADPDLGGKTALKRE